MLDHIKLREITDLARRKKAAEAKQQEEAKRARFRKLVQGYIEKLPQLCEEAALRGEDHFAFGPNENVPTSDRLRKSQQSVTIVEEELKASKIAYVYVNERFFIRW